MTARQRSANNALATVSVVALGVVFGDIGTSPLYAMRESFLGEGHVLAVTEENVLGIVSLVFWSLIIVISIKYLAVVMRADNDGEGGILALTSLIPAAQRHGTTVLVLVGLFGTALLYGDGMITPAISVLSAVEGTEVAVSGIEDWIAPIAIVILVALFAVQRHGTGSLGRVFGPVMVAWFGVIAVLGVTRLIDRPGVLEAINPVHAATFFADNGITGFRALGSVFLVVTGGEALYADMGHFGRRPIQVAWFTLVLPALMLNYFGQGALLLADPAAVDNPFYRMAPAATVLPLVVLATAATVIASQALISGAFSLTRQAVQLGYSPRVRIIHTSPHEIGQIYVPFVNWALMVACVGLVLGFRTSNSLANAYGVAVTTTMVITTVLLFAVLRGRFGWRLAPALALCSAFGVIDMAFFGANLYKIPAGGWFPLVAGAAVFTLMTTWRTGRRLVGERLRADEVPLAEYLESLAHNKHLARVPGSAVYLYSRAGMTPPALIANLRHNEVLHEKVTVVSVITADTPRVLPAERADITEHGTGITAVTLHFGFMEGPDVPKGLTEGRAAKLGFDPQQASYFLGSEALVVTKRPGMATWREHLFATASRNATPAANHFHLPPERTVTLGTQIEL